MLYLFALSLILIILYGARCFYKLFFCELKIKKYYAFTMSALGFVLIFALVMMFGDVCAGFMIHLLIVFIFSDIIGLICILPCIKKIADKSSLSVRHIRTIAVVAVALVMTVYGYFNAITTEVVKYSFSFDEKDFKPMRIMYVSDVHINTSKRQRVMDDIVDASEKCNPDVIVFGGDLVDHYTTRADLKYAAEVMKALSGQAEILYVYGNHDIWLSDMSMDYIEKILESCNVTVLDDESVSINGVNFIGRRESAVSMSGGKRKSIYDFEINPEKLNIVLDHQPKELMQLSDAGVDLSFSGHTHNGQIFPAGTLCSVLGINELEYGTEKFGDMTALVSSGVSTWAMTVRSQGKCEIVVADIGKNNQ